LRFKDSKIQGFKNSKFSYSVIQLFSHSFRDCESAILLCSRERTAGEFLRRKLSVNLRFIVLSTAPVCLVYALVHPGEWWLSCGFLVLSACNVALFVLMKYAYYRPGEKIIAGQVPAVLSALGMFILPLALLTLVLLPRYYLLSIRNLTPYLHDRD
jgi:hypothetical protein